VPNFFIPHSEIRIPHFFSLLVHPSEESEGFPNILRERGRKLQDISGYRVDEAERCGMKGLALEPLEPLPEGQWFN